MKSSEKSNWIYQIFAGPSQSKFRRDPPVKSFHREYHNRSENSNFSLMDIVEDFRAFKKDPNSQWKLDHYSQIVIILKLILVLPASNCTSERSFSAMKRIKTYLRTTMSQKRLNWLMILHVHKERTDKLSIERIVNLFVSRNEERLRIFGKCWVESKYAHYSREFLTKICYKYCFSKWK